MTTWANAIDQIQKPYTFACDGEVESTRYIGSRKCACCGKDFEVRLKHKTQKFCSRFCATLKGNLNKKAMTQGVAARAGHRRG